MTAEDDRRRDWLVFREEKQRQVKKAALRTLLKTSPLLGTRLVASLAPIFFLSCLVFSGLVCFSYFSIGADDLSASWNCRLVSI